MTDILTQKPVNAYEVLNNVMRAFVPIIVDAGATPEVILKHVLQHAPDRLELIQPDPKSGWDHARLAEELIGKNPDLNEAIAAAFKGADYTELARREVLQKRAPEASDQNRLLDAETAKAISTAWSNPFIGNSHVLLLEALRNGSSRTLLEYNNITSIVQSSGTGKSRMMNEARKLVFAIPVNIRNPSEDQKDKAYPLSDSEVHKYFVTNDLNSNLITHFLRFFDALFRNVLHLFDAQFRSEERQRGYNWKPTQRELAEWWSRVFDEKKADVYKNVTTEASGVVVHTDHMQHAKNSLERLLRAIEEKTAEFSPKGETAESSPEGKATGSVRVELLIYFDEAHTLVELDTEKNAKGSAQTLPEKTRYDHLCTAINHIRDGRAVYVFLSTASSVAKFAPPAHLARSARIASGRLSFPPPITETPFDCHPSLVNPETRIRAGPDLTMESVRSFDFMVRFGRPLFWSLRQGYHETVVENPGEAVIQLASDKLIESPANPDPNGKMAVIDVIHYLDYEPRRTNVGVFESTLVESYMRIVYSVPADRVYMRSGYPSEPILAEAACRWLWSWDETSSIVIDTLTSDTHNGLLSKGECGELTARILLSAAYRVAMNKEQPYPPSGTLHYNRGCQLLTFLRELFSEQFVDQIFQSYSDGRNSGPNLKTAFKTGIVRFTHFIKAGDDSSVTTEAAWAAFIRGAAIICKNCQAAIDLIIPVFLCDDPEKTPLCEHAMTAILIQVRDRRYATPMIHAEIDALELRFFPPVLKCEHRMRPDRPGKDSQPQTKAPPPYIALIMDLGVQTIISGGERNMSRNARGRVSDVFHNKIQREQPGREAKAPNAPQKRNRYTICVRGCSDKVYRVIRPNDRSKFAMFLQSRDLFAEHPRGEPWKHAVRSLKPVWTRGSPCYDWLVNDRLNEPTVQEQDVEQEGVDTGDVCYSAGPKDDL